MIMIVKNKNAFERLTHNKVRSNVVAGGNVTSQNFIFT